ncbi:hypothetical protein GCM10025875_23330 [Litorihabitans aurantiacus]|uniref:DUF305 domain-containing protein n=1 Tax=Litorihabitans aurantiacus TaxID=1930061 RepID=A0AA37XFQ6_9MICO|nr:hypothetical protein GCM10025875_23330 [Litorihabitans aurantiacus]
MTSTTRTTRTTRRIAAAALLGSLTLTACSGDGDPGGMEGMDHGDDRSSTATPTEDRAGDHNDADVMFAQMMIPHHEQAVEMSDIVLADPSVMPEVSDLAQQIKDAQAPEIETMSAWLADWGPSPPTAGWTTAAWITAGWAPTAAC